MKNAVYIFFVLLLVSFFVNASNASEYLETDQDNTILLKNAVFDPLKQPPASVNTGFATSQYSTGTDEYYILQFKGNVLEEWKQAVKNTGALFFDYVPNNAFIVRMNSSVKSQVEAMDIVQWVGTYQPAYKISPVFSASSIATTTTTTMTLDDDISDIIVMLFDSKHNAQVTSEIENLGGEIVDNGGEIMRVRIGTSKLSNIAAMTGVSWIEKYVQPVIFNDVAADIINVSYVRNTHGLTGSGQIVAVADTGLDTGVNDSTMHDDIEGRILKIYDRVGDGADDVASGHGTHVAGSVLGNGAMSDGTFKGMAPDAQLVFQAIGNTTDALFLPNNLTELFQQAYDNGARIHTNSWGSAVNGIYTAYSRDLDQFVWEHPDMLILMAAANEGVDSNSDGVIDLDSMGSPATAKNCISVGASENYRPNILNNYSIFRYSNYSEKYPADPINSDTLADNIEGLAAFSSRGPTDDGRIKPDIVAPGTAIISTKSSVTSETLWGPYATNANYVYSGGTSMSTPIVAGAAALVRQYYVQNEGVISPSAALIKSTIINGAYDMTPGQYGTDSTQEIQTHPDFAQGWGLMDIEKSLFPTSPRTMHYYDGISLTTSQSWNVNYSVSSSSEPLRVTIVWTDYPSAPFAGKTLVNDLDLSVTGPDGISLDNGGDTINNVEQVEIMSPAIGLYTITINGTNVPYGPQPFAIVVSGAFNPPVASDEFPTNNSYTNNSTTSVYVNITDSGSGLNLSSIEMSINDNPVIFTNVSINNGYKIENITSTPYDEGIVTVSINASDNASNSLTYNWSFTIDTTPPFINITYPTEGRVINTSTPNLNVTTNETSDIWYRVGSGNNSTAVRGIALNTTLSQLNDSTQHNITAFARDLAGNLNSTMVNFTIFATPATISTPTAGEIFYLPQNITFVNGTTTIGTNVSVYVNSVLVNESYKVTEGMFNISGVPLVNGTNVINVTAIYNDTTQDYFTINTSLTVSVGQILDIGGADNITIVVPGLPSLIKPPFIDFNITGQGNNIPDNISSSVVAAASAPPASNITGPAIDLSVPGNNSYTFNNSISLTLGYNNSSVVNFNKTVVAWYNESTSKWVSLRSTVNTTANTTTANVTHFTVFAPIEDNTPPANITALTSTGQTTSSITLSWTNYSDTDYIEIWRDNAHITNVSATSYTNSGLLPSRPYTYALRPVDIVENKGNWTNITVSTSTPASPPSGGGGGGGTSGEEYENIEFKDVSRVYISANTDASFTFSETGNDIQSIKYKALTSAGYISATIEVLKNTSTLVKQAPPGNVYKNMNIWVGKYGYATEKNIKDPVIGFKVQRSWIQDNRIDEDSIKLNRYSDEVWTALPTTRTDEDATFVYFESQTPGFSPFAISAHEKTISSQVFIKSETATESLSPVEEQPVETTTPDHEIESVEETSMWANLLIGALILIVAAGAYLYMRKRQS